MLRENIGQLVYADYTINVTTPIFSSEEEFERYYYTTLASSCYVIIHSVVLRCEARANKNMRCALMRSCVWVVNNKGVSMHNFQISMLDVQCCELN